MKVIVEFELMQERVQQLRGESSVAVHVHHESMETLHLRVATGELVSLLFTFERDITGSFFFGLGSAGDFLMVSLQFSDGSYLVFNLGEMFCGHLEGFFSGVSQQLQCSRLNGSYAMVEDAY